MKNKIIEGESRMKDFFKRVYEIVALIPEGKVTTYGQIALILGEPRSSRIVGWAMRATPEHLKLPTHRVVNRLGEMAPNNAFGDKELQRQMLISEGITFTGNRTIDLNKHFWIGPE
jgi:methylated-DNA-protein-cysteine methyltransferase related protein